jgi:hypothetical protein
MAARAQEISQEAGSRMAAAMKDVINAAAGIADFAIESARDLAQYMVRRGQMTQEEADKLIREAEAAQAGRPQVARPKSPTPAAGDGQRVSGPAAAMPTPTGTGAVRPTPAKAPTPVAVKTVAPAPPPAAKPAAAKKAAPAAPAAKSAAAKPAAKKPAAKAAAKPKAKKPAPKKKR